ncbi:MAG TPA: hypothetical protein VFG10_14705 [Saprospiraceae bacterium]|nr:hypothetical protein [Saprospiraceae bacterium]
MKNGLKYIIALLLTGMITVVQAQYSSTDIRYSSGHGPYPITINFQGSYAGNKNLFREFINDFNTKFGSDNRVALGGFSTNLEVVIVSPHFLRMFGWQGLSIQGGKLGINYRSFSKNIRNKENLRIQFHDETIGINFGHRFNLLYPFTMEVMGGPTIYNFSTISDHEDIRNDVDTSFTRTRLGNGIFERDPDQRKLCSGLDLKIRLNIFDPGGTEGGLGLVFEYGRMFTLGKRDLTALYEDFLDSAKESSKNWDYGYFSLGMTFPLALRMVSQ